MSPLISVVMSTYNRANYIAEAIDSVLMQTFKDFEFIIINDGSTDETSNILKKYKDERIIVYTNSKNCGCTFNYHNENNLVNSKYIAHIDDDDIWLQDKLKIQYEYMENHPEIAMSGTFIETFGENKRPSWVFYTNPSDIAFSMNLYNPICHSSVIYRKNFIKEKQINYDITKRCAQDFDFYKQIILKGGLISNIPEVYVKYRMHPIRLTDVKTTQKIQIEVAEQIKKELRSRYLTEKEIKLIEKLLDGFPFNEYKKADVIEAINIIENGILKSGQNYEESVNRIKTDIINNLFTF